MKFGSISECQEFVKRYKDVQEMKFYGNNNYAAQFIQEEYPNDISFDPNKILIANIDIEVESDKGFPDPDKAERMVQSIALKYFGRPTIYVWALPNSTGYDPAKTQLDVDPEDIYYIECAGEADLLLKFSEFWHSSDTCPDVVTGWNVRGFDIPYLVNRMMKTVGDECAKRLSPWNVLRPKTIGLHKQQAQVYEIVGVEQLDYYDLFQKFGYMTYGVLETYKLDHVAYTVLGEKKLSYEEHGNLFTLYAKDYQKFIDYNIKDVLLVEQIDQKMSLMELAMTIAYKGGTNYTEAFGTTQLWDTYIYRELSKQKKVVPPKIERPNMPIAGGHVKTPMVGRHTWVVSFDLNSLYPHLMMQYNMSPETIVDHRTDDGRELPR
jgi:DNA polymerase elongation subunit (family B)